MTSLGDESGATMVIVALLLIALVGFVVLVVDVGGLLTLRRQMNTAADAAALAAAQSCALDRPAEAPMVADQYAGENVQATTRTTFDLVGCGSSGFGSVDLAYEKSQQLYFAPVLGVPDTSQVEGTANAIWGPAASAPVVPHPMTLDTGGGETPCYADRTGDPCGYWLSEDRDADAYTNRSTGRFADLSTWPSSASRNCNGSGANNFELAGWLADNPVRSIDPATSTYVCVDSGGHSLVNYVGYRSLVGEMLNFPVNDSAGMIYRGRNANKFLMVGFTPLRLAAVYRGDDPAAVGTPDIQSTCATRIDDDELEPGEEIYLLGIVAPGCPLGVVPDRVDTPKVTNRQGQPYVVGTDYTYDAAALTITWLKDFGASGPGTGPGNGNGGGNGGPGGNGGGGGGNGPVPGLPDLGGGNQVVDIKYDWYIDGTTGACGQQSPDPRSICIVTRWEGAQLGGGSPAEGMPDFGVRAVRLDTKNRIKA